MITLDVELGPRRYPIHIGSGLLAQTAHYTAIAGRPLRLLTDEHVAAHYLAPLRSALPLSDEHVLVLPPGEATKTMASVDRVIDWLLATRLPRDGVLIALGGGVIGDHQVIFAGESEMITLSHRANDRALFANGALAAARWAFDKKPGFYDMLDVLGLDK